MHISAQRPPPGVSWRQAFQVWFIKEPEHQIIQEQVQKRRVQRASAVPQQRGGQSLVESSQEGPEARIKVLPFYLGDASLGWYRLGEKGKEVRKDTE